MGRERANGQARPEIPAEPGQADRMSLADISLESIRIQTMLPGDILAVAALERECFSMPWSENGFRMALEQPDNIFLTAKSGGMLLAYCGLYVMADEGEITNVAVRENCRGRGIGRQILEELLRRAGERGIRQIFLEVRESNLAARGLYEKLGFAACGRRKNFYDRPRENAVVMCREQFAG